MPICMFAHTGWQRGIKCRLPYVAISRTTLSTNQPLLIWLFCDRDMNFRVSTAGRRRRIGCLHLWVTFRKLATNYRALLREMTCKNKASHETLPCSVISVSMCMFAHRAMCKHIHKHMLRCGAMFAHIDVEHMLRCGTMFAHIHVCTYTCLHIYV